MNRQFHNKRQSLTVIGKQAGVGKLFDWSIKFYWLHVQHKIRRKGWRGGRGAFGKTCFLNTGEIVKLLLSNFGRVYFYESFELFWNFQRVLALLLLQLTHFMPLISFYTPWRFSDVFRGYRKRSVAWNGLTY